MKGKEVDNRESGAVSRAIGSVKGSRFSSNVNVLTFSVCANAIGNCEVSTGNDAV